MSYKSEFASNCIDFQTILDKINGLGKVIISFTISGTTYQADYQAYEGMTWLEWCNSSYNTDGYRTGTGSDKSVYTSAGYEVVNNNQSIIESNGVYTYDDSAPPDF